MAFSQDKFKWVRKGLPRLTPLTCSLLFFFDTTFLDQYKLLASRRFFLEPVCPSLLTEFLYELPNPLDADPPKSRLLVLSVVCLLYQADRLEDIGYVVEAPDLSLQLLGLVPVASRQVLLIVL